MVIVTNQEILTYEPLERKSPYLAWFDSLDVETVKRIDARLARVRAGNLGDYKALKRGIYELRFGFGPGYRIYFAREGRSVILLLGGGDKGSQSRDIETARELYAGYLAEKERI